MTKRESFRVGGIVQGVGFRPFLHRHARSNRLTGWVRNDGYGVIGEVQGEEADIASFLSGLSDPAVLPTLSRVYSVEHSPMPVQAGEDHFEVRQSDSNGKETLVSPDIATCPNCLRELRDPANRRYRYPFINCTDCGPRFTIVRRIPYDRCNTSMRVFPMCPDCEKEYKDIENRRYHAQPDCCPVCGPELWYANENGVRQAGDPFDLAEQTIRNCGTVAVKGLGGFHLCCLPEEAPVLRLRERKHRPAKPLAIMCANIEAAEKLVQVSTEEEALLQIPRRPIVLLKKLKRGSLSFLSENASIGVMLPYTPVHALLMDRFDALVMTSANDSRIPAVISNEEAFGSLRGIADGCLIHNRDIAVRCDDSLVSCLDGKEYFYRRSRGYAPQPLRSRGDATGILALGAEQKASFAMGKGEFIFYSQHIGDLRNAETFEHYETQISHFEDLFGIAPELAVCDLHPDYLSTRYAKESGLPILQVQHHEAHMLSCMEDNMLTGDCLGIIWDGMGLGTDGTVWGGEFFAGGLNGIARMVTLLPIPLPGGDEATLHIGRIAEALRFMCGLPAEQPLIRRMLEKKINCPESHGMGRLFDGVYALLTGEDAEPYDARAATMLEYLASGASEEQGFWDIPLTADENGLLIADYRPMICEIVSACLRNAQLKGDRAEGVQRANLSPIFDRCPAEKPSGITENLQTGNRTHDNEILAMRFHNSLVRMATEVCCRMREKTGLDRVVLSGGVFFNQILLSKLTRSLESEGFAVYHHHRVSTGDEGIALGQLAYAQAYRKKEKHVSCGAPPAHGDQG